MSISACMTSASDARVALLCEQCKRVKALEAEPGRRANKLHPANAILNGRWHTNAVELLESPCRAT